MARLEDVLRAKHEEGGGVGRGVEFVEDLGYWTGFADETPDDAWIKGEFGKAYRRGYQQGLDEGRLDRAEQHHHVIASAPDQDEPELIVVVPTAEEAREVVEMEKVKRPGDTVGYYTVKNERRRS